jgi:hypothetical protein
MLYSRSMWHLLHLIARPIEAVFGVFCVLSAIVLYPNEEGKIQSKFEDFWVRVDDFQNLPLTRHTAFMTGVAKLETRFLDRVFGNRLNSIRALGVSFCFSLGTIALLAMLVSYFIIPVQHPEANSTGAFLISLGYLICAVIVGAACIWIQNHNLLRNSIVIAALIFLLLCMVTFRVGAPGVTGEISVRILLLVLGGFGCDVIFITLTRQLLRWAGEMTSSLKVLATVIVNLFLAVLFVSPLLVGVNIKPIGDLRDQILITISMIAVSNIVDAVIALFYVLLAVLLLIHRLFWPLLTRTLFRMADIGTKGRRAILTSVGLALFSASVFGGKVPELLKDLVKIFGG